MKSFWTAFRLSIILSLLVGALFYVALQRHYPDWRELHLINASLSGMMAMFSIVAAGLFVYSMRSFKKELRRAYAVMCVGIVLFGLAQAQFPVASYFNAYFWYVDGYIGLAYLVSVVFIFLGVRSVARILKLETRWASFKWLALASVVLPFLVAFLPHTNSDLTPAQLIGSNVLTAFDAVVLGFAVMTLVQVRKSIGPRYLKAMTWLAIALGVNILAGIHYAVVNLITPSTFWWYFYDGMSAEPFFIGSILLVYAGYTMVMIDQPSRAVAVRAPSGKVILSPRGLPLIDIITYLASLASKPQEIDPTLDGLRSVTAGLGLDQRLLSAADERTLMDVYYRIQHYMVTDEPLRNFTVEELNSRLILEFQLDDEAAAELSGSPVRVSNGQPQASVA